MKKLFFALTVLLAGCQSERVAFHFQPVAPTLGSAPVSRTEHQAAASTGAPDSLPVSRALGATLAAKQPAQESKPTQRRSAASAWAAASALAVQRPAPAATAPRPLQRLLTRRLVRQHATAGLAHTTESGLGGIALFAIAVVLGALAGLGALVSLLPGISFFGGVGLAAAGLLVLFVLYSLVSGGKKKPVAK